jgi:hypothetical protein
MKSLLAITMMVLMLAGCYLQSDSDVIAQTDNTSDASELTTVVPKAGNEVPTPQTPRLDREDLRILAKNIAKRSIDLREELESICGMDLRAAIKIKNQIITVRDSWDVANATDEAKSEFMSCANLNGYVLDRFSICNGVATLPPEHAALKEKWWEEDIQMCEDQLISS